MLTKKYKAVGESFRRYWTHYGGLSEVIYSPYFHLALFLAICIAPAWADRFWFDTVIQILPNIVGFSIGGYAVWLGFGNEKFRALMAGGAAIDGTSPYLAASATFTHFVAVQVFALSIAVLAKALDFVPDKEGVITSLYYSLGVSPAVAAATMRLFGAFIGLLIFFYSLALTFATVLALMRLASMFDRFQTSDQGAGIQTPDQGAGK